MESHGPQTDDDVACKGDEVDFASLIAQTITDAQDTKVHKNEVRRCVEELCYVGCDVVVLLAPIQRGGLRTPDAIAGFAVGPLESQRHDCEDRPNGPERMNANGANWVLRVPRLVLWLKIPRASKKCYFSCDSMGC